MLVSLKSSNKQYLSAYLSTIIICITISFCHLSESRSVQPIEYFVFGSPEPFVYRAFLPLLFSKFYIVNNACITHLNFPISSCADLTALCIDSISLTLACLIIFSTFKKLGTGAASAFRRPQLVIAFFLWMVVFNYIAVPNRSIYYPYDFPELFFFSLGAYFGTRYSFGKYVLPVLVFISAFNKETALFLPFIYLVYRGFSGKIDNSEIISVTISVLAAFAGKYVSIYYVTHIIGVGNGAPNVYENHLHDNVHQLLNPIAWLAWASTFGGALFFILDPKEIKQRFNVIFLALLAAWLVVVFTVGLAREIRLFGFLIFPLLLPIMLRAESFLYANNQSPS